MQLLDQLAMNKDSLKKLGSKGKKKWLMILNENHFGGCEQNKNDVLRKMDFIFCSCRHHIGGIILIIFVLLSFHLDQI